MTLPPTLDPVKPKDPIVAIYSEYGTKMYVNLREVDLITELRGLHSHTVTPHEILYYKPLDATDEFLYFDILIRGKEYSCRVGEYKTTLPYAMIHIDGRVGKVFDVTKFYQQHQDLVEYWRQIQRR